MKKSLLFLLLAIMIAPLITKAQDDKPFLIPYLKGDLFGYVDANKKMVIEPQFKFASFFKDSKEGYFAKAYLNGNEVKIYPDGKTELVAQPVFEDQSIDGGIFIFSPNTKSIDSVFMDRIKVNSADFKAEYETRKGYYEVFKKYFVLTSKKTNKMGIIDESGKIILPFDYYEIWPYEPIFNMTTHNMVRVRGANKFGVFSLNGDWALPLEYDHIDSPKEIRGKYGKLKKDNLYGYFDKSNLFKVIFPPKYKFANGFGTDGCPIDFAKASIDGINYFYVNKKGVEYYEP